MSTNNSFKLEQAPDRQNRDPDKEQNAPEFVRQNLLQLAERFKIHQNYILSILDKLSKVRDLLQ